MTTNIPPSSLIYESLCPLRETLHVRVLVGSQVCVGTRTRPLLFSLTCGSED